MTAHDVKPRLPAGIEIVELQAFQRRIAPEAILSALHERGLRRILIEGGAETVSRFLVADCLDRLHVVVSPIIIGNGRPSAFKSFRRSSACKKRCAHQRRSTNWMATCCSIAI